MRRYLWIIAFIISLVQVNTQTTGDHASQSYFNTQLPYSSGYLGVTNGKLGAVGTLQGLNNGYSSQQQFGFPQQYSTVTPYSSSVDYQSNLQYQQYPQPFQQYQFPSLKSAAVGNGGPIGGRSASRAIRLQHLHTKAVPSRIASFLDKPQGTFLPFNINSEFASIAPTAVTYSSSTPKTMVYPQISSTINSVPSLPPIPSAPPLPTVPSTLPQIKVSYPKQLYSNDGSFSMTSSIPIAEGHSVGNNVAYTFNTGYGNALGSNSALQPFTFPAFTGFAAQPQVFSGHSGFGTGQGTSAYSSFPTGLQAPSGLLDHGGSSYSFGTTGYDNEFGTLSNFGASYGDNFARIFNNVFKRDSKLKISPFNTDKTKSTKSHS